MTAIRADMRLSAISHCVALAESLLGAVERALEWHPGDAIAGAAVRAAVDDLRHVAQDLRDADAGVDAHCLYRLMMALPFSASVVPPAPPPLAPPPATPLGQRGRPASRGPPAPSTSPTRGAPPPPPAPVAPRPPVDQYAASRALGRVYDLTRLPNAALRHAANRAVSWASEWARTIADARRAVLFPPPPAAPSRPDRVDRPLRARGATSAPRVPPRASSGAPAPSAAPASGHLATAHRRGAAGEAAPIIGVSLPLASLLDSLPPGAPGSPYEPP